MANKISTEAIIYPSFNAIYYSFYILGLTRFFPDLRIAYANNGYPLRHVSYLPLVINEKKVLIDATDYPVVDQLALDWCDICGKVNIPNSDNSNENSLKFFPIGPGFGIKLWPIHNALPLAMRNFASSKLDQKYLRMFMSGYVHQSISRLSIDEYIPGEVEDAYVFSVNSYWSKEEGAKTANEFRKNFIECVKDHDSLTFEGGFYKKSPIEDPTFRNFQVDQPYKLKKYLENVKRSLLVFNTPAVKGCLGWKLGEFLALGKAIITTPINQKLPSDFIHRKHVHFVDGSKSSIEEAIVTIQRDPAYRIYLEENARKYYLDYLVPEKVISRLLQQVL